MILILDGDSGTGKTTICQHLVDKGWNYIGKYTDRPLRNEEKQENINSETLGKFIDSKFFKNISNERYIHYTYGKYNYALDREEIDLEKNTCFVLRDINAINTIKKEYSSVAKLIFIYSSSNCINERLNELRYSQEEVNSRILRNPRSIDNYMNNIHAYDGVIINDSVFDESITMLNSLLDKWRKEK